MRYLIPTCILLLLSIISSCSEISDDNTNNGDTLHIVSDTVYIITVDTLYIDSDTIYVFNNDTITYNDTIYIVDSDTIYYPQETPPFPPTQFSITQNESNVSLNWVESISNDVTNYAIYRNSQYIDFTTGDNYTDNSPIYGSENCYYVNSVDSTGLISISTPEVCISVDIDDPELFSVRLVTNIVYNCAQWCEIYQNTTDNVIFSWEDMCSYEVYIEEDLLPAGDYLVKTGRTSSAGNYQSSAVYSLSIGNNDVQLTIDADYPENQTITIDYWYP